MSNRRVTCASEWLLARAPTEEIVIVGATLDAANELARQVANQRGAVFGWHRLTLAQLVAATASRGLAASGLAAVGRIGAEAVATRVVHQLKSEGRLGRFAPVSTTPGFPKAVAQVLSEVRLAHLSSDRVGSVAPDLVPVIEAYQAELAQARLVDWPGMLELAIQSVSSEDATNLTGLPLLLLDVPIVSEAERVFCRGDRASGTGNLRHVAEG